MHKYIHTHIYTHISIRELASRGYKVEYFKDAELLVDITEHKLVQILILVRIHAHTHIHLHAHTYIHLHIHMHILSNMLIYIYICICMLTHHAHTYSFIQVPEHIVLTPQEKKELLARYLPTYRSSNILIHAHTCLYVLIHIFIHTGIAWSQVSCHAYKSSTPLQGTLDWLRSR